MDQSNNPLDTMMLFLTGKRLSETKKKDRAIKFPMKLMYIIECGFYTDVICWCPSGSAFLVLDPQLFERKVLPDIFKESKYSSFERKVRRWGFVKAKNNKGTRSSCYGHPNFRKGDYPRCLLISCSETNRFNAHQSYQSFCPASNQTMSVVPENCVSGRNSNCREHMGSFRSSPTSTNNSISTAGPRLCNEQQIMSSATNTRFNISLLQRDHPNVNEVPSMNHTGSRTFQMERVQRTRFVNGPTIVPALVDQYYYNQEEAQFLSRPCNNAIVYRRDTFPTLMGMRR